MHEFYYDSFRFFFATTVLSIFRLKKYLNGHTPLIKQHVTMNLAPLDSSPQDVFSKPKKLYLGPFIFDRKKLIFFAHNIL
jgi:hypothetical protein